MKNLSFIINSPLEQFEVTSLLSIQIPVLGYTTITLTNLALYSILVLTLIIVLHNISNNDNKLVPSKWSIALESIFSTITSIVRDQIGIINERYLPFIYSLFFFVLFANLIGNIPYNFTVTTSLIVSIGLSFTIFIGVTILGLVVKKLALALVLAGINSERSLSPKVMCVKDSVCVPSNLDKRLCRADIVAS